MGNPAPGPGPAPTTPNPTPTPTPTPPPTPQPGSNGRITDTGIIMQRDGLIAAGDGYVAFGSTSGGVSFVRVGEKTATNIIGDFDASAVYCAGQKIVLVASGTGKRAVSIFDPATGSATAIPDTDVFDISPGSFLENSNIAVDGSLVAILHRGDAGKVLKLIDASANPPKVTTFAAEFLNADNVALDSVGGQVAVMEDNTTIALFATTAAADAVPIRYNVKDSSGVAIAYAPSIRIGGNSALFTEINSGDAYVLNMVTGTVTKLAHNRSAANSGLANFDIRAGFFAYFLERTNAGDVDAQQGNRVAVGLAADPAQIALAGGAQLADGALAGFGLSVGIAPNGSATYIAGRTSQTPGGGVNSPAFVQANFGSGFDVLRDVNGQTVIGSDVNVRDNLVAIKIVTAGNDVHVGYYLP